MVKDSYEDMMRNHTAFKKCTGYFEEDPLKHQPKKIFYTWDKSCKKNIENESEIEEVN